MIEADGRIAGIVKGRSRRIRSGKVWLDFMGSDQHMHSYFSTSPTPDVTCTTFHTCDSDTNATCSYGCSVAKGKPSKEDGVEEAIPALLAHSSNGRGLNALVRLNVLKQPADSERRGIILLEVGDIATTHNVVDDLQAV